MRYCAWLYEIVPADSARWGREAAALAEVARTGVPVAPSFAIARELVFSYFNEPATRKLITRAVEGAPLSKAHLLTGAAADIRKHILKSPLPAALRNGIAPYFEEFEDQLLHAKGGALEVILTAQNHSRLSVHGTVKKLADVDLLFRKLLALHFEDAALHSRLESEDIIVPAAFAVLVQLGRESAFSGEAYKFDPETKDETIITIRVRHHERGKHAHATEEDLYRFDAKTAAPLSKLEEKHHWAAKKGGHATPKRKAATGLEGPQLSRLAKMVRRAQEPFSELQTFEWYSETSHLALCSVRPFNAETEPLANAISPLLHGVVGNLGVASGPVRILRTAKDLERLRDGDVAVLEHIPDSAAEHLAGIAALICETGHGSSREAKLARQLGIPAVLGAAHAFTQLREGGVVTVDGSHGAVYAGVRRVHEVPAFTPPAPTIGTKVSAVVRDMLDIPSDLGDFDAVGVLRSEQILDLLGVHPQDILRKGAAEEYTRLLAEGIERIARAVHPRVVTYQLHDLANVFMGRSKHRNEPNPILGYRGAHRLLAEPETLELELAALDAVIQRGISNVQLMVPMVRSVSELEKVAAYLRNASERFEIPSKVWVRCETPALAIQAEELADSGIDGVLFDLSALSALIVGIDGGNHQVGHHLDHADEAVLQALRYAIATCRVHGVSTALAIEGEMPPAEAVEAAVRSGVTSVVVEPAYGKSVRGLIASIEQRMLVEHVLDEQ